MKQMNKTWLKRASAWLMSGVLLLGLCVPIARAAEGESVIRIASLKDWQEFSEHCRLDTWSQDKVVILEKDLDLTGEGAVPTFGGSFDGNGHLITGFQVTEERDHVGLFRYLQDGGTIKNLNVMGHLTPGGDSDSVGGIVGVNSGTVDQCSFEGVLSGSSAVGGIVGFNGETGQVLHCKNRAGLVTGEHSTGGVAGINYGTILGSSNAAKINTQESGVTPQLDTVDWTKLNSTENMPARTDTGGVVGFSSGVIKDCTNGGVIGYPHTGYNVGGIAGRQSGFLSGCSNSGSVRGRKEVGGIVGQMEPYTLLRYREDTLQKLYRELDGLGAVMREALDSTDATRGLLSGHITNITGQTGQAKDGVKDLLDEVESLGDGTVDTVNELSRRIKRVIDQMEPVTGGVQDASAQLTQALDELERALAAAGSASGSASGAVSHMKGVLKELDDALRTLLTGVPVPLQEHRHRGILERLEEIKRFKELVRAVIDYLPQAKDEVSDAYDELVLAVEGMGDAKGELDRMVRKMKASVQELVGGSDYVEDALSDLHSMIQEQSDLPELEFPSLSEGFHEKEDNLNDVLGALNEEMEKLNQSANQGGDALSGSLRKLNDQFASVVRVLREAKDETRDPEDKVVDVSDEDIASAVQGKVIGCTNTGSVDGDVNIGGINGAMAIEYDFDPEDDIKNQGEQSVHFQFLTRVILQDCVNMGPVRSRKDCVGGVTGRMDLGVALGCENYGDVESTGGQYTGGVAGQSQGVIRSCWSKCTLTGTRYIGGVAGWAADIRSCRTMVDMDGSLPYAGAIAGGMDAQGNLSENYFVGAHLGGVDGVSYAGKAEPMAYEEFVNQTQLPERFRTIQITFLVDGTATAHREVNYGGALKPEDIPEIPEREGYFGSWGDFQRENITFDQVVEANYAPWLTAVSSEDGAILAEGLFTPDSILHKCEDDHTPPEGEVLGQWRIETENNRPFTALRISQPEEHCTVWRLLEDGSWEKLPGTMEGRFQRVEFSGQEAVVCLTRDQEQNWLWLAGALAAGAAVVIFVAVRKKKKTADTRKEQEPVE